MRWSYLVLPAAIILSFGIESKAATEENAEDFMGAFIRLRSSSMKPAQLRISI